MSVEVSAPGTLMVLGEHAVLHGRRALVAAVDRRLIVRAVACAARTVRIISALGKFEGDLDRLPDQPPFRFVLAALRRQASSLAHGLELHIESTFSDQVGLGSSAAVTVAATAAIYALKGVVPSPRTLHAECWATVREVQGAGSGSDIAASVLGGIVEYRTEPPRLISVSAAPPIVLMFCGFKTPTPKVIRAVEARRAADPARYELLFDAMDRSVTEARTCLTQGDWAGAGRILNANHLLMRELGVSNPELDEIQSLLTEQPGVYGAKISGSGLGDCVLALGETDARDPRYPTIPVSISSQGVRYDPT